MPSDSSSELVEMVRKEIREEMTKAETDRGSKRLSTMQSHMSRKRDPTL